MLRAWKTGQLQKKSVAILFFNVFFLCVEGRVMVWVFWVFYWCANFCYFWFLFPCCLCLFFFFFYLFICWQPWPVMWDKAAGGFPGWEGADPGGFPCSTTSSTASPLDWPLPQARCQCNRTSPLNDFSNNWSLFSCKHRVSLDKCTVNTLMVPISNGF